MPPASYCIKQFKHAERVEPDPNSNLSEDSLAVLYDIVWKNQDEGALLFHKEPVQRDESRLKNVEVPEYMTVLKWEGSASFLDGHGVTGILVRGTYCRSLWAIESALWPQRDTTMDVDSDTQYNPFKTNATFSKSESVEGIIVSGGPGIGKTLFMVYVLALCLLARQPVVWQTDSNHVLVFVEEGVFLCPLHWNLPRYIPAEAFYLIDCNRNCSGGPDHNLITSLIKSGKGKLLYFASLRYQNMEFTGKEPLEVQTLFMEQCTPEDLVCCRLLWDKAVSEQQIEAFIKLYGCSARNTYLYARKLAQFEARIDYPLNKQVLFDALAQTSAALKSPSKEDRDSHDIFYIEPDTTDPWTYTIKIHTRHIYDVLMQRLRTLERRAAADLFRMFCSNAKSRACAGFIIEDWAIGRLRQGGEWRLNTMEVSARRKKNSHWRDVGNGDECVDTPSFYPIDKFSYNSSDDGKSEALPKADGIGIPVKANQPTFDLFVWLADEKRAIMVQVTVSPSHSIVKEGLAQLKKAGAEHLDLIVVTPALQGESMDVYTDKDDESMLEHVYHLTVTDGDMEEIPEAVVNL
ncbi:uncharacterized protein FOMMEDRAFT_159321 [Fomitiporia mediterranea MF3/22]|uniref:uncharacterized protein n=1 Tax=Fomitiporia mediterranea (strain MF3/22) TaxID=694068 RepID=UPI00044083C7|nr:uncharacterized protein FOMMEDRAFT_159321 [Fomitiporia mediterranea MF3/22]EJD00576.1 hypothetical protein FOMMEDRAFT_159321 [Fomitiporia mediterranea MF3/22]